MFTYIILPFFSHIFLNKNFIPVDICSICYCSNIRSCPLSKFRNVSAFGDKIIQKPLGTYFVNKTRCSHEKLPSLLFFTFLSDFVRSALSWISLGLQKFSFQKIFCTFLSTKMNALLLCSLRTKSNIRKITCRPLYRIIYI